MAEPLAKCHACGHHSVPEDITAAMNEIGGLSEVGLTVLGELLTAIHLHGMPKGRGWNGAAWDMLRALGQPIADAVGEHGASVMHEFYVAKYEPEDEPTDKPGGAL